jgi:hypothetical protein
VAMTSLTLVGNCAGSPERIIVAGTPNVKIYEALKPQPGDLVVANRAIARSMAPISRPSCGARALIP